VEACEFTNTAALLSHREKICFEFLGNGIPPVSLAIELVTVMY
jgi:hypothetical protein